MLLLILLAPATVCVSFICSLKSILSEDFFICKISESRAFQLYFFPGNSWFESIYKRHFPYVEIATTLTAIVSVYYQPLKIYMAQFCLLKVMFY